MRPKYVQANNQGIIIAPMIDRPLPKAIVGPGLLAQIIIDKYVDHFRCTGRWNVLKEKASTSLTALSVTG